ncbi:MAG: hypothetical protein P8L89_03910, partial [Polaribacter sp.]|nr:hypothetical protein [Polaribacter sp.]
MKDIENKLKNPVWYSLKETHKKFTIEYDGVHFYQPDICIFGAFFDESKTAKALNETHQSFLIEYEGVRFYRPEICTFG